MCDVIFCVHVERCGVTLLVLIVTRERFVRHSTEVTMCVSSDTVMQSRRYKGGTVVDVSRTVQEASLCFVDAYLIRYQPIRIFMNETEDAAKLCLLMLTVLYTLYLKPRAHLQNIYF